MKTIFYTGKGDNGKSTLCNTSHQLPKDNLIFNLLGTLDELNSWLGLCKASFNDFNSHNTQIIKDSFEQTQENIFIIQAEVAGANKKLLITHVQALEKSIKVISKELNSIQSFFLPGGCVLSSFLDISRTVARRCERIYIKSCNNNILPKSEISGIYLNRLSSFLYILVRFVNQHNNITEKAPLYNS